LALGLALTPCAALASAALLRGAHIGAALADALAFAGAALLPVFGLASGARYKGALVVALCVGLLAGSVLLTLAAFGARVGPTVSLVAVDSALVALAWSVGASIGRRVQHASHLLPACVVAASADLVSLLSPEGPSHAIAQSDRALSVLATWFPVPGGHALAPALGVGDLLFMGLVLGVARAQALPYTRTVFLCALGTALAGVAAATLGVAIPALLPIAACLIAGLPAVRALRSNERKAALWSMLIAGSVALASIARNFLVRS
jgi:hypothetical protein